VLPVDGYAGSERLSVPGDIVLAGLLGPRPAKTLRLARGDRFARRVKTERLEVARQHFHCGNAALLDI
jgi:hypothetical protein